MTILFKNARILTLVDHEPLFLGDVLVIDERIAFVGASYQGKEKLNRVIDLKGNVLMPGFKNAHTHSAMTFLRSYADDLPLKQWLEEKVFPIEATMLPEDIYHLSKVAIAEYVSGGITSAFDMYLYPEQTMKAAIDLGFRMVGVATVNSFKESVAKVKDYYQRFNHGYHPLISYQLGFHAEYTTGPRILKELGQLAQELKAPVYGHISETALEVEDCIKRTGMRPPRYLESLGLFNFGGGAYHAVHFNDEDIALFKKHQLHIVHNPGSNTKLASGIAPIQTFLDHGLNVALGTDGPASNNALDMFKEMMLTFSLQKIKYANAQIPNPFDVLNMATINGAKAMGLKQCETLTVGSLADLIVIDLQQPNMQPLIDIPKNIVYSGSKSNIQLTMIHGKIVYENGQYYFSESIDSIYQAAQRVTDRLLNQGK